jgi:SAM-dependent methyltransferase
MCHRSCIEFGLSHLREDDVRGKQVIDVGSLDINGSFRPIVERFNPGSYIGVDIESGPGVDEICNAEDLIDRFGKERFDLVICAETLEHIRNWRRAVSNLKNLLKPNGVLLATTRSLGFDYHGHPFDFWRYEVNDARILFSDLRIETVERDPEMPGVFVRARRPESFKEHDLTHYNLYSVISSKRCSDVGEIDFLILKVRLRSAELWDEFRAHLSRMLPKPLKTLIKKTFMGRRGE